MDKETKGSSVRRSFSAEFRAEAVRLVSSGERSQAEVARSLGIGTSTIHKWCREAKAKDGVSASSAETAEVKELKAEIRRLKLEQEILKKAAAYFAKYQM
jgi:transposase